MPQLDWDEQEVLEYLVVLPEVEEYETSHRYTLGADGLSLRVTIWQWESAVQLTLSRDGTAEEITNFALIVRDRIRYRNEKWGEYLEFKDCVLSPDRFFHIYVGDVFDRGLFSKGLLVKLFVRPTIRIEFGWAGFA
jgi:hypothetical protein